MSGVARKYHTIPLAVWIALGLFVMLLSYRLGLGGLHNPGPGLMPFLLGFLLCATSFYILLASRQHKEDRDGARDQSGQLRLGKLTIVLTSLFAYPLLLERLGYLVTTLLVLTILFRTMSNRWFSVIVASFLTVVISYLIFTYLGIRFPKGILKGL